MGGYVTMALLRIAPERVGGLVLIDTKAAADTAEARAGRLAMADRVEAEGVGFLPEAMLANLLGSTTRERRPEVVQRVRDMILDQPPAGVAWAQRAMADRPDSFDTLRSADVPALVLVGEEDELTRADQARAMAEALPNALLEVIRAAGHLAPVEAPEAVAEVIASLWR